MLAVGLHHLGAGRGQRAAAQQAVGLAGERIAQRRIGEREQVGLPGRVLRMARVAAGQAETDIGRHPPRAGDMRHQPVEHDAALQVLVEAEIEEVAQEAAGLRDAEADRAADGRMQAVEQRIGRRRIAAQEARDIAHRGKAHAEQRRIARRVGDLVERAGIEAVGPRDLDGCGIDEAGREA